MVELTKLNGTKVLVNCDLIRTVEAKPDTVLRFVDGETMMVRERVDEVTALVIAFKRRILDKGADGKEPTAWT